MKTISIFLFCILTSVAFAQLPQLEKPIKIDKNPKLPENLTIVQPDLAVTHFSMTRAIDQGYFEGAHWYKAVFTARVRNIGDTDARNFYVSFFVNDYSHPASGDSWWYNQTKRVETVGLYDVSATAGVETSPASGTNNSLLVSRIQKGTTKTIRGTFFIKKEFVDHYHISIAVDSKRGATNHIPSNGVLREHSENNNVSKVIPRS